jgi:hypothetical protein
VSAFRLTRRGRAGIKRREEILEQLKHRKAVTPDEILAEKVRSTLPMNPTPPLLP